MNINRIELSKTVLEEAESLISIYKEEIEKTLKNVLLLNREGEVESFTVGNAEIAKLIVFYLKAQGWTSVSWYDPTYYDTEVRVGYQGNFLKNQSDSQEQWRMSRWDEL